MSGSNSWPRVSAYRTTSSQCRPQRSPYCGDASSRSIAAARSAAGRKASRAAGVGGRPVRAKVARRSQTAGSAGGAGVSFAASSFASRKRSTGSRGQAASVTAGIAGRATGCQHQCAAFRPARSKASFLTVAPASAATSSGHGAPAFTHASKSATTASGNLPAGGMSRSVFAYRRASSSVPLVASLGTTAAPLSPPARRCARPSTRSPALSDFVVALWHL